MNLRQRLSLHQATTMNWPLDAAVAGCLDAGIAGIGVWREHLPRDGGLKRVAALLRGAGLRVSTLSPAGFFTATESNARGAAQEQNRRAIREAAALGAETLCLVCGGLPGGSRDLATARRMVLDGIAELVPYAEEFGVRLAIEPLHPRVCAEASVVVTLGQALQLAETFPANTVGVVVDVWSSWWDPQIIDAIHRAAERIFSFQICDWLFEQPANPKLGRGHVGDGVADVAGLVSAVADTGYQGLVEVEIFNEEVWRTPGRQTIATMLARCDLVQTPSASPARLQ